MGLGLKDVLLVVFAFTTSGVLFGHFVEYPMRFPHEIFGVSALLIALQWIVWAGSGHKTSRKVLLREFGLSLFFVSFSVFSLIAVYANRHPLIITGTVAAFVAAYIGIEKASADSRAGLSPEL